MGEKYYIGAQDLLEDSFRLGLRVLQSGFRPDFIVGVWRGGTPVGIAVQEIMHVFGREVRVHGLGYVIRNVDREDSLLIVDDVFDTGLSIQAVLETLKLKARRNTPGDIRIATPWYKPYNNQTGLVPDYYLHESDQWLVFPHELDGLSQAEMIANKPGLARILDETRLEPPPR